MEMNNIAGIPKATDNKNKEMMMNTFYRTSSFGMVANIGKNKK